MERRTNLHKRHRFPPEIIHCAVWLYYRFSRGHRDIEGLSSRRGVIVTKESIRLWCNTLGPHFSRRPRRRHAGFGDTILIDEVFVTVAERRHNVCRAVDQYGDVIDVYLQTQRDAMAARRSLQWLPRSHGKRPWQIVTDKLGS